jgi:hypothetical protein
MHYPIYLRHRMASQTRHLWAADEVAPRIHYHLWTGTFWPGATPSPDRHLATTSESSDSALGTCLSILSTDGFGSCLAKLLC